MGDKNLKVWKFKFKKGRKISETLKMLLTLLWYVLNPHKTTCTCPALIHNFCLIIASFNHTTILLLIKLVLTDTCTALDIFTVVNIGNS
jgi:hypothetical protein